jgi:hypothetical protein
VETPVEEVLTTVETTATAETPATAKTITTAGNQRTPTTVIISPIA